MDVITTTLTAGQLAGQIADRLAQRQKWEQETLMRLISEPAHGLVSKAFRLAAGEKQTIRLNERMNTRAIMFSTVPRAGAGAIYVTLARSMDINPVGHATAPSLPTFSEAAWDFVAELGGNSKKFYSPADLEVITIFATAACDGVIYAGSQPQFLPG